MELQTIEYNTKGGKRTIRPELVNCDGVYNVPIYEGEEMIGRAILTRHIRNINGSFHFEDAIVLMDIYIYKEEHRRQGAADDLMEFITHAFKKIMTGTSTKEGRELCYKWGFKMEIINKTKYLIYKKEGADAVQKSEPKA